MKIGVFATFMSPIAGPQMIADFARRVEDAGIESLWMGEHVVLFDEMEFPYPASKDGRIPVPEGGGMLDTVSTFGFIANCTSRLRLGTGVSLISQRNPLYTAKEFATLDWLSNGRMDFGVGVGWCKEEVLASGYSWEDRGARADEFLELTRILWTDELAQYQGEHFQLSPCRLDPKPVQKPHIPIIVGGHSPRALRRAAEHGSGWYGFALPVDITAKLIGQLDRALEHAGRQRDDFELIITPSSLDDESYAAYQEMGVDRLVLPLGSQRPHALERRLPEIERWVAV
ncbi:MAG: LLM class F420-dependent oxidoreductase [Pseudomonadales bacterium]